MMNLAVKNGILTLKSQINPKRRENGLITHMCKARSA